MKALRLALPTAALGTALLALSSPSTRAFSTLGTSLDVDQRDVRVFDNFPHPTSNDNTTPDPQFPGYTGIALAIWKASVEWGSTLHGDGSGDPTQPFDLGSGAANFDVTWQGYSPDAGNVHANLHLAFDGGATGLLAYTEQGAGGWKILYNTAYAWDDGPGLPAPSEVDTQSVATHEYGHALGLGHSGVFGAVMSPALSGTSARDLALDDIAGLQFIYGAAAPDKPRIDALAVAGNTLTITGANFDAFGNEVWFTQKGVNPDGEPVVLAGVTSTGAGSAIAVSVPPDAGPGDVLVRTPGSSGADLSNAFPFDPVCGFETYGTDLGGANVATLTASANPVLGQPFSILADGFAGDAPGFCSFALGQAALPLFGGTLLLDPLQLVATLDVPIIGGALALPLTIAPSPGLAGLEVFVQVAAVDGTAPLGVGLSNGLALTLCE